MKESRRLIQRDNGRDSFFVFVIECQDMEHAPYPDAYLEGIRAFNEGRYFECHELLESLWLEAGGIEEIFYQALIQEAVAIYHLENKNLFGATSLFRAGLEKLAKVADFYMGLSVRDFEKEIRQFFEPYLSLDSGDQIQMDVSLIPKIKLKAGDNL